MHWQLMGKAILRTFNAFQGLFYSLNGSDEAIIAG